MQPSQSEIDTRPGQIYAIFNVDRPEFVEYVGQTVTSLESRRKGHIYDALSRNRKSTVPMHNFIRKYGAEKIGIRSLRNCTGYEELNRAEEETILEYRLRGEARLNVRDGGSNSPVAEESREKLRKAFSGEKSPVTKLTWEKVNAARQMYLDGVSLDEIGSFLNISPRQRDKILRNRQWVDSSYVVPPRRTTAKVTWDVVNQIREDALKKHEPRNDIAHRYGISAVLVEKILGNKLWGDPNYDPSTLPPVDYSLRARTGPKRVLSDSEILDIRKRHALGETPSSIRRDYTRVSYATVRNVALRLGSYRAIE